MTAIQNQQPGITHLIVLNGQEITEHNRLFDGGTLINAATLELSNGNRRRYIKKNKNLYNLSFSYLPDLETKTIDGRKARNYLLQLARTPAAVSLSIKLDPNEPFYNTTVFIDAYSESLIRRDIPNQCAYYDVQISMREA